MDEVKIIEDMLNKKLKDDRVKALVSSKSREVKKQISELIIALSTADSVKFIKEDINE